ncbi:MAG: DUF3099 domain-containing protein [Rothia sp. (in: high G+C Gram-positive bacteria)]|nr:DUF3099 domain-containing protein [Rothia sp. (in: high G+C Gram-positive bacteria)]
MSSKIWTAEDLHEYGLGSSSTAHDKPEVHSITGAQAPHSESVDDRFKAYALKMALRVVCIVAACFSHGWLMWAFIAGAAILPWVAVVFANGNDRAATSEFSQFLPPEQRRQIEAARMNADAPKAHPSDYNEAREDRSKDFNGDVIDGEIIEDDLQSEHQ